MIDPSDRTQPVVMVPKQRQECQSKLIAVVSVRGKISTVPMVVSRHHSKWTAIVSTVYYLVVSRFAAEGSKFGKDTYNVERKKQSAHI